MPAHTAPEGEGKRRPVPDDLQPLLTLIADGKSLRRACETLGLDPPSTHTWLSQDDDRRQQYAHAREARADHYQEQVLDMGMATATSREVEINGEKVTVDPAGYRAYVDAVKWATARMAPKTAPVSRHSHTFEDLSEEELNARIAAKLAAASAPEEP